MPAPLPHWQRRLNDSLLADVAGNGLLAIGSDAEDALIAAAGAGDSKTSIAAIELLGDLGMEKSLDLMRRAQVSRDRSVRSTAMTAVAKINRRRLKSKQKPESD